ncbi:hypothetical protein IAR50_001946 [Cryptococcus sp. DSM 104548]
MTELDTRLERFLEGRKQKGRFRSLKEYDTSASSSLVDFSSNDYLSLTSSPAFRTLYLERLATAESILGSTGSRLLSGCSPSHSSLELRLADFFNSPSALLFNSGWDANVSFFGTVPQASDWVVYDELVHASVHSGLRSSRVPLERRIPFSHNDPEAFARGLRRITSTESSQTSTVFLALESLYSMDGDMSPLPALLDTMEKCIPRSRMCVVVDEAHSTGVYGRQGRGVVHALEEEGGWSADDERRRGKSRVDVRLMTFGKAVGCSGAVLLCSPTVRTFLINFARPFIFSTAMPHSTVIALQCVWDILQGNEGEERRDKLMGIARYLHSLLDGLLATTSPRVLCLSPNPVIPFPSSSSQLPADPPTPILGLLTPTPHALAAFLLERGFIVRPVVPPTVPPGGERVRICLRADLGEDVVYRLVQTLRAWVDCQAPSKAKL